MSLNKVENLFMWNNDYYHVFNTTDYKFAVAEGEFRIIKDKFIVVMNHSYTRLFDMDYSEHGTVIEGNAYVKQVENPDGNGMIDLDNWYTNIGTVDNPYYVPVANGVVSDTINAIYDMISVDNEHFLNLASHITKLTFDFYPTDKVRLHYDNRIFWSPMKGRELIYNDEATYNTDLWWATDPTYQEWFQKYGRPNTLGIEDGIMLKANFAAAFDLSENVTFTAGVKNIFADPTSDNEFIKRNSLRWQLMVSHGDQDLYTPDCRSFFGKINIAF